MDIFLEINRQAKTIEASGDSACYFPIEKGRYEVKPGFVPFGTDFGNSVADARVFQIDSNFTHYREVKLLARAERLSKYYQTHNYFPHVASAIARLIIDRLTQEHPQYFCSEYLSNGDLAFHNYLTQETLYLNSDWQLQQVETPTHSVIPPYASTLDALATQVQEDLTVLCRSADGSHWLSAAHVCYPSYWSIEEKIGKDFATIHAPVAGIEKINQRSQGIVNTMIVRKPMVRFTWGLSTNTRLNHHPEPPSHIPSHEWQDRLFTKKNPQLFLRIERQVIWGLPECEAALFTIHPYFRDCAEIKKDPILRSQLSSAVESMTTASLLYKGLAESKDEILAWLKDETTS